jgi:hypothetical protein
VRSWLLELLHDAMERDPALEKIRGYVDDSGEGRWTIEAAMAENVPAPITSIALFNAFASRQEESFSREGHRGAPQRVRRPRGEARKVPDGDGTAERSRRRSSSSAVPATCPGGSSFRLSSTSSWRA